MNKRCIALAVVIPLSAGLTLATSPGFAGTSDRHSTTYAFRSTGYGTKVIGGQVPAGSSTTAYQIIGCTNQAGIDKFNNVAEAQVPGLGTVSGVKTHVWTSERHGKVASHSTHKIAKIKLVSSVLGSLVVKAVTSKSLAVHDGSGFHARTVTTIGSISFTPTGGDPQSLPAPTPDQPITIPGLVKIFAGRTKTVHDATGAFAEAVALRIDVIPTDTSVHIARTLAQLNSGLTYGVFGGHSDATRVVTAAGDIAHSGPNPLTVMPCQGTYGETHRKSLAAVDLGGQFVVNGLTSQERSDQDTHSAHGYERGAVAKLNLGQGQLVVDGIVGKASVSRSGHGVVRSAKGTRLGSITANGQAMTFPPTGVLEIPGVAKLERKVVHRTKTGLQVIALRVTLLDGSGAVVDLGEANLRIRRLPH